MNLSLSLLHNCLIQIELEQIIPRHLILINTVGNTINSGETYPLFITTELEAWTEDLANMLVEGQLWIENYTQQLAEARNSNHQIIRSLLAANLTILAHRHSMLETYSNALDITRNKQGEMEQGIEYQVPDDGSQ